MRFERSIEMFGGVIGILRPGGSNFYRWTRVYPDQRLRYMLTVTAEPVGAVSQGAYARGVWPDTPLSIPCPGILDRHRHCARGQSALEENPDSFVPVGVLNLQSPGLLIYTSRLDRPAPKGDETNIYG